MSNFSSSNFKAHDDYMTPKKAWSDIQHLIPRDKVVWESFYGNGQSGTFLTELGFTTVHGNHDFFTTDHGEIIVSNPPFSKIKEVLARMFELDKPFILIMPSSKINTRYFREWKDKGVQIIIPSKRINFDKIVDGTVAKSKSNSNFDCFYYCYRMNLVKDITWLSDGDAPSLRGEVAADEDLPATETSDDAEVDEMANVPRRKRTVEGYLKDEFVVEDDEQASVPAGGGRYVEGEEEIDENGVYRYSLHRQWDATKQDLLWVMLNPSSATDKTNDPTMRRCMDFAIDNGYGSMTVVNLFALRSTDPSFLTHKKSGLGVAELVGNPQTDLKIEQYVRGCGGLCIAWGRLSTTLLRQRASSVMENLLRLQGTLGFEILCLGQNLEGQPKHPLYIKKGTKFKPYDSTQVKTLPRKKRVKLVVDVKTTDTGREGGGTLSEREREIAWEERESHDTWWCAMAGEKMGER